MLFAQCVLVAVAASAIAITPIKFVLFTIYQHQVGKTVWKSVNEQMKLMEQWIEKNVFLINNL